MFKLMLVEDDDYARKGLEDLFSSQGFACHSYADAESAWDDFETLTPDICILDRALPAMSGDELCQKMRTLRASLPILILSGKGAESERIEGLELGADDYVTKPYSIQELLARIDAMCRRIPLLSEPTSKAGFTMDNLYIDPSRMVAVRDEVEIELTPRERDILTLLHDKKGQIVSRDDLFNECWGRDYFANSRSLDQYISSLRAKIERDPKAPRIIKTARGVGYWFNP